MATPKTVTLIYANGVFTPVEKIKLRPREKVRAKIIPFAPPTRKTTPRKRVCADLTKDELVKQRIRESFGRWADRDDIGDAVEWVNEIRAGWEERMKRIYSDG
ncbi:MAG: antitoxin family protein [Chloroflexi bacterium]|nr:antitoxin family protein [Chloroflexota bacterium]